MLAATLAGTAPVLATEPVARSEPFPNPTRWQPSGPLAANEPATSGSPRSYPQVRPSAGVDGNDGAPAGAAESLPAHGFAAAATLALLLLGLQVRSDRARRRLLASSQRDQAMLRSLLDSTPDLIFFKTPDGRVTACNSACAAALGKRPEEIVGHRDQTLFAAGGDPREHERTVIEEHQTVRYRVHFQRADGQGVALEILKSPVRGETGQVVGLVGVARDVTADDQLIERVHLAAEVFEHASEGIVITDPRGVIEAVNPAFSRITGYTTEEMIGSRPSKLASGRQDKHFYRAMWERLLATGQWQGEIWNRRRSGEIYPEWLNISSVTNADGQLTHFVGVFSDISLIKSHEARLEHMAHHDPLTDLPNRALLVDRMDLAIRRAEREHEMFAVVFVDLDHFKDINDSYGHQVGDEVLRAVAKRISGALREGDTVARLGGDEFVALFERIEAAEAAEQGASRIFTQLTQPLTIGEQEFYLGASIGIAVYPRDGDSSHELLRNADTAMYQAKNQGRNLVQSYFAAQTASVRQRAQIENALRRAVAQDRISVAYQPQFDIASGNLVGIEALARWRDQELGDVAPSEFIPAAESNGLIVPLGEMIIRKTCAQIVAWRTAGLEPPRVAVNVSGRQLRQPDFVDNLQQIIDELHCRPEWLEIEVTESDMLRGADHSIDVLGRIRALGINVALDDFGTGYSSLSYLKRLPVHSIKIDRSFIDGLPGDINDRAIVAAILALGNALTLNVLAEGVESAGQAAYLGENGCRQAQGYYYGRPVASTELASLLAGRGGVPSEPLM